MDTSDRNLSLLEAEHSSITTSDAHGKILARDGGGPYVTTVSEHVEMMKEGLSSLHSMEERIALCLEQMEAILRAPQGNGLKAFWEIRKFCLPMFQQVEDIAKRADLWNRYIELTKEGRIVKSLQDEEEAFLVGQIELAISCLEQDVAGFLQGDVAAKEYGDQELFLEAQSLEKHRSFYKSSLASVVWLGSFATRIIDLRKELMNVGMRMRLKSKFFQRLSSLGHDVFPRRKEVIETVSSTFSEDVDAFVSRYFVKGAKESLKRALFFLRKEIKNLQQAAKSLAISSAVFSTTRLKLSQCWDQLKALEKELRQEQVRLRAVSSDNVALVKKQLDEVVDTFRSDGDLVRYRRSLESISKQVRGLELIHDDVVLLRKELQGLFESLREQESIVERAYREQLAKEEEAKQKVIQEITERVVSFLDNCASGNISNEAKQQWQELKDILVKTPFMPAAKRSALDNQLGRAWKYIVNFFEEQLLASPDIREKLINMRQVLAQRQERRSELKAKLEHDKKLLGSSGLDFDRAMQYSSIVEEDRRAIEELDAGILDLKRQIQQLT